MNNRKTLLATLLQTLVNEWGYEQVEAALAGTSVCKHPLHRSAIGMKLRPKSGNAKLGAVEQVERSSMNTEQKGILLKIAERYDRKEFLPGVADVREFIIMIGERPVGMKDRREAFRVLLQSLVRVPTERLEHMASTAMLTGPSELGLLSDAIAAAGLRLPRHSQATVESNTL